MAAAAAAGCCWLLAAAGCCWLLLLLLLLAAGFGCLFCIRHVEQCSPLSGSGQVLYFTLLGLRAAASDHEGIPADGGVLAGQEGDPVRAVDLAEAASMQTERQSMSSSWATAEDLANHKASLDRMSFKFKAYSTGCYRRLRSHFGVSDRAFVSSLAGYKNERFDGPPRLTHTFSHTLM